MFQTFAPIDISHAVDLWNPFVWITTIRRGGQEDGEVVAEFEMGLARRRARLALRGQDDMLVNVVKKAALWGWVVYVHMV